jgi:hypothetical protein
VKFAQQFPLERYRRLTFLMLDRESLGIGPSMATVCLQGRQADPDMGRQALQKRHRLRPIPGSHQYRHVDVPHIDVAGTFYYLYSLLDNYTRSFRLHYAIGYIIQQDKFLG